MFGHHIYISCSTGFAFLFLSDILTLNSSFSVYPSLDSSAIGNMSNMANLALDGGDPRLAGTDGKIAGQGVVSYTRPQMRALHDPTVSFEEYHYYANQSRAIENAEVVPKRQNRGFLSTIIPDIGQSTDEKRRASLVPGVNVSDRDQHATVTDEEWINASRAVRTATAGAIFYLITTDILGPFGLPYASATTGWG
jgi:hypothetical protein